MGGKKKGKVRQKIRELAEGAAAGLSGDRKDKIHSQESAKFALLGAGEDGDDEEVARNGDGEQNGAVRLAAAIQHDQSNDHDDEDGSESEYGVHAPDGTSSGSTGEEEQTQPSNGLHTNGNGNGSSFHSSGKPPETAAGRRASATNGDSHAASRRPATDAATAEGDSNAAQGGSVTVPVNLNGGGSEVPPSPAHTFPDGQDGHDGDGIELLPRDSNGEADNQHGGGGGGGGHAHGIDPNQKCNSVRAMINILKAYVGSGVLGLPFASSQGGLMAGVIGMITVSILSTVCVFLLLDCKKKLGSRAKSFGDVGFGACGRVGHITVEACVVMSQMGFCVAYIIFITENLWRYVKFMFATPESMVWILIPALVLLCWIRSMQVLAPFSLMSVLLIFGGLLAVALHSWPLLGHGSNVQMFIPSSLPIFVGMAIYSFEGIGLALPIENSMERPDRFPFVWILAMVIVTSTYVVFGAFGYSCYGDEVPSIITMVLPDNAYSLLVKLGLAVALLFTYPIAMYPVFEIVEESWFLQMLKSPEANGYNTPDDAWQALEQRALWKRRFARFLLVVLTALAATVIPDFSIVMAFIGSVPSNIMAFVLPSLFHARIFWRHMGFLGRLRDLALLLLGGTAVVICTWTTLFGVDTPRPGRRWGGWAPEGTSLAPW